MTFTATPTKKRSACFVVEQDIKELTGDGCQGGYSRRGIHRLRFINLTVNTKQRFLLTFELQDSSCVICQNEIVTICQKGESTYTRPFPLAQTYFRSPENEVHTHLCCCAVDLCEFAMYVHISNEVYASVSGLRVERLEERGMTLSVTRG